MDNICCVSPLTNFAHKSYKWFSSDTYELFLENIKNNKQQLINNDWLDKEIHYDINSLGFRGPEFNLSPSIMFLGCSHVFGVGICYNETWPYILSQELNLQCLNLGTNGSSNDTAFRMAYSYIPKYNPTIVVLLSPNESRLEIIDGNYPYRLQPRWHKLESKNRWRHFYHDWIVNDTNTLLNKEKNIMAISKICSDNNIKFVKFDASSFEFLDYGRDLLHYGRLSNKNIARKFLKLIN